LSRKVKVRAKPDPYLTGIEEAGKRQAQAHASVCLLSIDPGINGTGWALWRNQTLKKAGIIRVAKRGMDWREKSLEVAREVSVLVATHRVAAVACEYPEYMQSQKGEMVARRGDLVKLAFLTGVIAGRCCPLDAAMVPVHMWKGQLSKENVERRIRRILTREEGYDICGLLDLKSHMWDAVGVGLFMQGRF